MRFGSAKFSTVIVPLIFLSLVVLIYYPGYMSFDSVSQLQQARSQTLTDWHPPLMSWLWGRMDALWPGPAGMLVFHNLLFWAGLSIFTYALIPSRGLAWFCIAVIGFFPPIIALLGTIWKDVGMAAALLLACALLFYAEQKHARSAFWLALPFLFYGLAVRHNAVFAVMPLSFWASHIAIKLYPLKTGRTKAAIFTGGLLLLLTLLTVTRVLSNRLTQGQKPSLVHQTIYVHDLVAIALATGKIELPSYLPSPSFTDLQGIYTTDEIVPLFCCDSTKRRFTLTTETEQVTELRKVWLSAVLAHPVPYLSHRINVFMGQLGIGKAHVCLPFQGGTIENALDVPTHHTRLNRALMWRLEHRQDSFYFRGWVYLAILLLYFLLAIKQKLGPHSASILALSGSGLCYVLAYLFISTTCDFRMNWWTVLVTLLIPVFLVQPVITVWEQKRPRISAMLSSGEIRITWKTNIES